MVGPRTQTMTASTSRFAKSFCVVRGCDCMKEKQQCRALTTRSTYSDPHRCEKKAADKGLCSVHLRRKLDGLKVPLA